MDSNFNFDSVFNSINIDFKQKNINDDDSLKKSNEQFSYSMIIDKKKPTDDLSHKNKTVKKVEQQHIYDWVDDSKVTQCYSCETDFTFFTRKHHCRYCGKIFCYACSGNYIVIPNEYKLIEKTFNNWGFFSNFSKKERVCDKCHEIIEKKNNIYNKMNVFLLIDLNLKDYAKIAQVCKEWRTISLNYFSKFRKLQYVMPDHNYTKFEQKILWDNRILIQNHSQYLMTFINSINWKTISKQHSDEIIALLYKSNKKTQCWNLMCSRLCKEKLTPENVLFLLDSKIENYIVLKFVLQQLINVPSKIIVCFLPNLIHYIKFSLDKDDPLIVKFLIVKAQKSYKMANFIIWELTNQMKDPEYSKMYENIRTVIYSALKPSIKELLKKSFQFTNKLPKYINEKDDNKNTIDNIILSIKPELKCIGINYSNIITKNSFSKPTITELLCTQITKKPNFAQSFKIMYKKEDIRIDLIITNIIKIMDYILKSEEGLDLNICTYNVLPIDINKGFIEIIDNSKTLFEIQKMGFTIQNWIIENNPDTKINDLRKRFTLSCAAYCVISYLLGIGDRHLDNIMITKDGYLFHIDYSYILGKEAKFLEPEIRITPDMIDAMGGQTSKNYTLFKKMCSKTFNCLRRHSNLFLILLSSLDTIKPKIHNGKYSLNYIKKQIISRFIPGENYNQAKLIFNTKVNRKRSSSYSEMFIDFCHKNAQEKNLLSKVGDLSKGMFGYIWSSSS